MNPPFKLGDRVRYNDNMLREYPSLVGLRGGSWLNTYTVKRCNKYQEGGGYWEVWYIEGAWDRSTDVEMCKRAAPLSPFEQSLQDYIDEELAAITAE